MRRLIAIGFVVAAGTAIFVLGVAAGNGDQYRVRAIFDNANQVTVGEQVRTAGVTIGVIETLDVTPDNKAAVVLRIDNPGYTGFTTTAHCIIRPQSLIGEQYIDCSLTRPISASEAPAPKLEKITSGPGQGQYLLPLANTSSPVGPDLLNNIMRVPERQRFAVILNELGIALSGNGATLNDVIRRANPALQQTDLVLAKLANQNKLLAKLADESAQSLAPLARDRASISSFIRSSEKVARASHERSADLQANFQKLPIFLAGLTPTMNALSNFSKSLTTFVEPLGPNASSINSLVSNVPAVTNYSGIALAQQFAQPAGSPGDPTAAAACKSTATKCSLGQVALTGTSVLTNPTVCAVNPSKTGCESPSGIYGLKTLAAGLKPLSKNLGNFLSSIQTTGGWEFLMQLLYAGSGNANGFNETGHYGRGLLMLNPDTNPCVTPNAYRSPFTYSGCSANFDGGVISEAAAAMAKVAKAAKADPGINLISRLLGAPVAGQADSKRDQARALLGVADQPKLQAPVQSSATSAPPTAPAAGVGGQQSGGNSGSPLVDYLLGGGGK